MLCTNILYISNFKIIIMKRILITTGLIGAVILTTFCGCQREKTVENAEISIYDEMGQLHNEAMDFMFEKMKGQNITRTVTDYQIRELTAEYANDFFEYEGSQKLTADNIIAPIVIYNDQVKTFAIERYEIPTVDEYYFNKLAELYFDIDEADDIRIILRGILSIEREITTNNNISGIDKDRLLYAMAICKNSTEYWYQNLPELTVVINGEEYGGATRGFWNNLLRTSLKTGMVDCLGGLLGSLPGAVTASFYYAVGNLVDSVVDIILPE